MVSSKQEQPNQRRNDPLHLTTINLDDCNKSSHSVAVDPKIYLQNEWHKTGSKCEQLCDCNNEAAPSTVSSKAAPIRPQYKYSEFETNLQSRNSFRKLIKVRQFAIPTNTNLQLDLETQVLQENNALCCHQHKKIPATLHQGYLSMKECILLSASESNENHQQLLHYLTDIKAGQLWFQLLQSTDGSPLLKIKTTPQGMTITRTGNLKIEAMLQVEGQSQSFSINCNDTLMICLSSESTNDIHMWISLIKEALTKPSQKISDFRNGENAKAHKLHPLTQYNRILKTDSSIIEPVESKQFCEVTLKPVTPKSTVGTDCDLARTRWNCLSKIVGKCFM